MDHTADWWLGDLDDPWFKALENAVYNEWGIEPLRIREGGVGVPAYILVLLLTKLTRLISKSIPSVPFLEKELKCHALHLPMGQSSVRYILSASSLNPCANSLARRIKLICQMSAFRSRT